MFNSVLYFGRKGCFYSSKIREFLKKTGEKVQIGEPLIRCFNSDKPKLQNTVNRLESVFQIGEKQIFHPLIY